MLSILKGVNDSINQFEYLYDGPRDHWQDPIEFLENEAGDCEDFAITKYFILREMGIPDKNLRITYCLLPPYSTAHMVLLAMIDGEEYILDNRATDVIPRQEFRAEPVYGFNTEGLYIFDPNWESFRVGSALRVTRWNAILCKVEDIEKNMQNMLDKLEDLQL